MWRNVPLFTTWIRFREVHKNEHNEAGKEVPAMKLADEDKLYYLSSLWWVTEFCYSGVELPTREMFERLVKGGDIFLFGNAVGYALVTPSTVPLLVSIAVLPASQGVGIGKDLLREVSNYYRSQGRQQIVLHCKTDNPAQILYFKEGYRVTAYLRNYYKPEGDGLEMRKML
jgi:ribosomal protein S18 acetylase RimI-like enzyme